MAAYVKFEQFIEDVFVGVHTLDSDVLRLALSNTAPTAATDTIFLVGTLHPAPAAANGYPANGATPTITTAAQTGGTFTLAANQVVFTATAGGIGPFRYVILYNDTPAGPVDPLISYWDHGTSPTLADGETFTVKFNSTDPGTIFTAA